MAIKVVTKANVVSLRTMTRGAVTNDDVTQDWLTLPIVASFDEGLRQGQCQKLLVEYTASESAIMAQCASIIASKDAKMTQDIKDKAKARMDAIWLDVATNDARKDGLVFENHKYASKANVFMKKHKDAFLESRISVRPQLGINEDVYKCFVVVVRVKGKANMRGSVVLAIGATQATNDELDAAMALIAPKDAPKAKVG